MISIFPEQTSCSSWVEMTTLFFKRLCEMLSAQQGSQVRSLLEEKSKGRMGGCRRGGSSEPSTGLVPSHASSLGAVLPQQGKRTPMCLLYVAFSPTSLICYSDPCYTLRLWPVEVGEGRKRVKFLIKNLCAAIHGGYARAHMHTSLGSEYCLNAFWTFRFSF